LIEQGFLEEALKPVHISKYFDPAK